MNISEISIFEYLTGFRSLSTPLSDFYLKTKRCRIFGEEHGRGLLLYEKEILFLAAEKNDPAVKTAMLDYLRSTLPAGETIRWRIQENSGEKSFAESYGFRVENIVNLFRTVGAGDERVEQFFRDNEKLVHYIEKRGYLTRSFDELTEAQLSEIRDNPEGKFESGLHPEVLMQDLVGGFSGKMSSAALRDGKVAAYVIVRSPDTKHCIFEIICVAEPERRSGVFILPFIRSLKAMDDFGAESVFFAVFENNTEAIKIVRRKFGSLIVSQKVQFNMRID